MDANGALILPPDNLGYALGDSVEDIAQYPFEASPDERKQAVLFVHGINCTVDDEQGYARSFYKRLWWEGYRGRFATFRWPTTLLAKDYKQLFSIFNSGEYRSWKAGTSLKKYVETSLRPQIGAQATIGLVAHSLGNACAGDALRQGLKVDRYVAMEAAVSLSCYYPEPVNPASDPLAGSFVASLVQADASSPTPHYTSQLGYRGYLSEIKANSGAKCIAYQNIDDFWLATGKTATITYIGGDEFTPPQPVILDVDWVTNQHDHKPDDPFGYGVYLYNPTTGPNYEYGIGTGKWTRKVGDPHEAMAYIARSRTRALGAEPDTTGTQIPPGFEDSVNLQKTYGFNRPRFDHSGQFQRNIQLMYGNEAGVPWGESLYHRLMRDLNVDQP